EEVAGQHVVGAEDALEGEDDVAGELGRPVPAFAPRILLRLTAEPVTGPGRHAGEGTLDQVLADLDALRQLGADTVVLDPFAGDPAETLHPQTAWHALAAVAGHWDLESRDPSKEDDDDDPR
ncbi:hypothetical protein ACWCSD_37910, partial [Nonomuraea sp. NPDC001684]